MGVQRRLHPAALYLATTATAAASQNKNINKHPWWAKRLAFRAVSGFTRHRLLQTGPPGSRGAAR
jgi:hypothetical protein